MICFASSTRCWRHVQIRTAPRDYPVIFCDCWNGSTAANKLLHSQQHARVFAWIEQRIKPDAEHSGTRNIGRLRGVASGSFTGWHDSCLLSMRRDASTSMLAVQIYSLDTKEQTMKKLKIVITLIALTLATSLAFAADAEAPKDAAKYIDPKPWTYKTERLDRAQLDKLLGHPEKLLIVDVRRPDELTRIGGFPIYLSIQIKDLKKAWLTYPRGARS